METIVELPEFLRRSSTLLRDEERASVINYLAAHPQSGDVLQGMGVSGSYAGPHKAKVRVAVSG